MENSPTIRLKSSLAQFHALVAPVYGDPLAGWHACKCRFLTPIMHFDSRLGLA
jgi:hypothetical protein